MSVIEQRAKYWKESYHKRSNKCNDLTPDEKSDIEHYWNKYYSETIPFDLVFHKFYKDKSGASFDKRIVPVDLYYCYIDPYYNNWNIAKTMDNKALYSQLFKNINQPVTFFTRRNGIWVDGNGMLTNQKEINKCIIENKEVIVKQANFSEGGEGCMLH